MTTSSSWLDAVWEEYKLQRTTVADIRKSSQHTVTFGGATAGILAAAGFNVWSEALPATLVFLVAIPLISSAVIAQWTGQMLAVGHANRYVWLLQKTIRDTLEPADGGASHVLFSKPTYVSAKWWRPNHRWLENAAIIVFGLIAVGSLFLGAYKGFADYTALVVTLGSVEFVGLGAIAVLLLRTLGGFYRGERTESVRDLGDRARPPA